MFGKEKKRRKEDPKPRDQPKQPWKSNPNPTRAQFPLSSLPGLRPTSSRCGSPVLSPARGPAAQPHQPNLVRPFSFSWPSSGPHPHPSSSAAQRPGASASPAPRSPSARARTVRMTERAHPSAPFAHRNVARLLTAWPHTAGPSPSSARASAHATEPRCPWTQAAPRACSPARPLARTPSLTLRPHGANLPSPMRYVATTGRTFRP